MNHHEQKLSNRFSPERKIRVSNHAASNLCIAYLLLMLAFLAWQLFDTWAGRYSLLRPIGYDLQGREALRLIAFTLIAGALGGVINGLRSTIHYHESFQRRHSWKYLCAPWMGATLALFVYALLRSSIDVLGGNSAGTITSSQVVSNFSVGALVGYGSKDVFVWLDAKVAKFFNVASSDAKQKRVKNGSGPVKNRQPKRKTNRVGRSQPGMPREAPSSVALSSDSMH